MIYFYTIQNCLRRFPRVRHSRAINVPRPRQCKCLNSRSSSSSTRFAFASPAPSPWSSTNSPSRPRHPRPPASLSESHGVRSKCAAEPQHRSRECPRDDRCTSTRDTPVNPLDGDHPPPHGPTPKERSERLLLTSPKQRSVCCEMRTRSHGRSSHESHFRTPRATPTVATRHSQIISWVRVCMPFAITSLVCAALFVIVWMLSSRGVTVTLHVYRT